MSPAYLRDLGFQRNQPEDREGLSRTRRPGRRHLAHSGGWQKTEGNHTHTGINIPIQQFISMEHGQQEVQPGISLERTWSKLPEDLSAVQTPGGEGKQDKGESSHYRSYRRTTDPYRAHLDSFRLTRRRPNQLSSGFTPFRNQQVSGQESPFFTLPGGFQEKTKTQGKEQDLLSPKAERVRANDPETVGIGKRSTQEPEVVVNNSIINSTLHRNINPTQIEHNSVSP
ncbi:hypothetical protein O181_039878 [Austropuccinia psidii MF-1]|uniref:Uncharacterized protein n=1 Tax=Austropuccinia psidii MF-1 TaxID=1389203 RepID=A0A9Q3DE88_9BASI|nr:hypothetical protein [Austropuccinia psidii MF-1]